MHGIEAKGDSKAATGGLVAVRTMWVSIASLGLSVLSVRGWLGGGRKRERDESQRPADSERSRKGSRSKSGIFFG